MLKKQLLVLHLLKTNTIKLLKDGGNDILISSCCHSVNLLIQKYFPNCLKYLANVMSLMQAHCSDIVKRYPKAKTIFVGPCVAKKDEGERYKGIVDCVLTFEELSKWLEEENIEIDKTILEEKMKIVRQDLFPTSWWYFKNYEL